MSQELRIILIVASVLVLIYVLRKIRQSKLQIENALFWILSAFVLVIVAVFPQIIYGLADIMGFISPANLVFVIIIGLLLLKVFMLSLELSRLEGKVRELVETIAIEEKKKATK